MMKTDVNYVLSTAEETDSGNVVCLLSALSGKEETEIDASAGCVAVAARQ